MEFQTRNELYRWVLESVGKVTSEAGRLNLPILGQGIVGPPQIEYSKLNISNTVLSKRKLIELVNDKIVTGWDDPRMPTIQGLKRRGYTPDAINDFCHRIGMGFGISSQSLVDYSLLEECLRQDLENKAPRIMAVLHPLKVNITNISNDSLKNVTALNFPNLKDKSTTRNILVGNVIYIEKCDFQMEDSPKYYRLAPNKIVRLKYFGLIKCIDIKTDENKNPVELFVELLPENYKPPKRIRETINWVSEIDHTDVQIRIYKHLFSHDGSTNDDQWKTKLNQNSIEKKIIKADCSIKTAKQFDKFQFERIGFFSVDSMDLVENRLILNQIVPLKEDKNK